MRPAGTGVSLHLPARPSWACTGCSAPWPCPTRRLELTAEYAYAHVSLSLYLTSCLVEASHDMPSAEAGALYQRFLGWLRDPPRPGTGR